MQLSRWPNRTFVLLGALLIVYSLMLAFLLMTFGWGGFQFESLTVRILGYGTVSGIFLAGVAAATYGTCRRLCRHPRPS